MTILNEKTICICPAYNEDTRIGDFLKKFKESKEKLVDEILVVNDGSTDKTSEVARSFNVIVLDHTKRKGTGGALKTGIKYAQENGFTAIVTISTNGKDDPLEIPIILKPILENETSYVQGSRYLNGIRTGKYMPWQRHVGVKLYSFLTRLVTGFHATDSTNGFRAFRTSIFNDERINIWQDWLNGYSLEIYLYLKALRLKYGIVEVPISKIYPQPIYSFNFSQSGSLSKVKPVIGQWQMIKPLIFYVLGVI